VKKSDVGSGNKTVIIDGSKNLRKIEKFAESDGQKMSLEQIRSLEKNLKNEGSTLKKRGVKGDGGSDSDSEENLKEYIFDRRNEKVLKVDGPGARKVEPKIMGARFVPQQIRHKRSNVPLEH
jgi:hypothetical protein